MTFLSLSEPSLDRAIANPQAIYCLPQMRFSLLGARLLRIEYSPSNRFEDRPSQQFWYRQQPVTPCKCEYSGDHFFLDTRFFRLTYQDDPGAPALENLKIDLTQSGKTVHLDDPNPGVLPGTARTLDETNGPIALKPGLVSRSGWVLIDDTPNLVFNQDGWLEPRPLEEGYRDLYLLVCDQNYKAALKDYQKVAGFPSLLPRAMLGNWWSRYWEYSHDQIRQLVERFCREQIPLSVFVIDMDWHITRTGNRCSGWTGFTWNRELFPDPEGLITWLHEHNLISSLNLHPAEGIHPHEEAYLRAARSMGINPRSKKPIPFEIADPDFAGVYFNELLHPLEEQGVDFWWVDWQQGKQSRMRGLDPLWWLNHLHYYDLGRDGKKRPVVFSRWGGPGNHRYPIGFSGDTIVSWKSLAYQPYFTASAANAAYGWWSHDIGGHMDGMEDGELYTRWVQFGVLSPIFRLHCSKYEFLDRQPWSYDGEILNLTRQAMQFRHVLVPYLYTLSRRNEQEGLPPVTPLYYDWPEREEAYLVGGQYLLGDALMAAPVTSPLDPDLKRSRQGVWFPPGEWYDSFTGERHTGPRWEIHYDRLQDIPLFARAGAIIPLQADRHSNGSPNPVEMDVLIFPGADGSFTLYEDDGVTQKYRRAGGCTTAFSSHWSGTSLSVKIQPAGGDISAIPQRRTVRFLFRGILEPDACRVELDGQQAQAQSTYEPETNTSVVGPLDMWTDQQVCVEISMSNSSLLPAPPTLRSRVLSLLKTARIRTGVKGMIYGACEQLLVDPSPLASPEFHLSESQQLAIVETLTGAGAVEIPQPGGGSRVVLVNPVGHPGFSCRGKDRIAIDPAGTILTESARPVRIDYFGLLQKYC